MMGLTEAEADRFAVEYARLVKSGVPESQREPNGWSNPAYWQALAPIFSDRVMAEYKKRGGSLLWDALHE